MSLHDAFGEGRKPTVQSLPDLIGLDVTEDAWNKAFLYASDHDTAALIAGMALLGRTIRQAAAEAQKRYEKNEMKGMIGPR